MRRWSQSVRRLAVVALVAATGIAWAHPGTLAAKEAGAAGVASARVVDPVSATYTRPWIVGGAECSDPVAAKRCAGVIALEGGASVEYSLSVTGTGAAGSIIDASGLPWSGKTDRLGPQGSAMVGIGGATGDLPVKNGESQSGHILVQVSYL